MIGKLKQRASLMSPRNSLKENLSLKIKYRRIDELKPDPANPRRHTKKQIRQLGKSLQAFGFIVPVLIDGDDNLIAGHGRVLAGRDVGIAEVPTLCLDHLSPAEARAFMVAILPAPVPRSRRPGIGNGVALAQAMALGFGVIENAPLTPAAAEISALAEEIRSAISG
jgi:hypothetical protein